MACISEVIKAGAKLVKTDKSDKADKAKELLTALTLWTTVPGTSINETIQKCLAILQEKVPDLEDTPPLENVVPSVIATGLLAVGVWPVKGSEDMTRDDILDKGSILWDGVEEFPTLKEIWNFTVNEEGIAEDNFAEDGTKKKQKKTKLIQKRGLLVRFPSISEKVIHRTSESYRLREPRDGPNAIWEDVGKLTGRRLVLSYVQDKRLNKFTDVKKNSDGRRGAMITNEELDFVEKPTFFCSASTIDIGEIWHDGMKYRSPDEEWHAFAGIVPYFMPGSAVWHMVPRIRDSEMPYPTTGNGKSLTESDRIIKCFSRIRNGSVEIHDLDDDITVKTETDKPYRDLRGVRRLWLLAEATCGMMRDDLLISVEDMAGLALTFMHFDNLIADLETVFRNSEKNSKIKKKKRCGCCFSQTKITWRELISFGEGAKIIAKQTLLAVGLRYTGNEKLFQAMNDFRSQVTVLKYWYSLMLATGEITNHSKIRFELLEDIAVAPAWEHKDRAKVYIMIEASLVNRFERMIPYDESIKRFMRSREENGGHLLIQAVHQSAVPIEMEITRRQLLRLVTLSYMAEIRNPGFTRYNKIFLNSWMEGADGLRYLGRFTASASKMLYINAAQEWANHDSATIIKNATDSKRRMSVLLTEKHRLHYRLIKSDADESTDMEVIICSVFFLSEEQHNVVTSRFGNDNFHAEERVFRGNTKSWDKDNNAVDYEYERKSVCLVHKNGSYIELDKTGQRAYTDIYQIVVTQKKNEKHAHLIAVRSTQSEEVRPQPVPISITDVQRHMAAGDKTLFTMRCDQVSPDGENLVDYGFEYSYYWADEDGTAHSTDLQKNTSEFVRDLIYSLREKQWDSIPEKKEVP